MLEEALEFGRNHRMNLSIPNSFEIERAGSLGSQNRYIPKNLGRTPGPKKGSRWLLSSPPDRRVSLSFLVCLIFLVPSILKSLQVSIYFKVKIDGLPIPEGRLVKGPYINQYVGTVSHVLFELLYDFQFQERFYLCGGPNSHLTAAF